MQSSENDPLTSIAATLGKLEERSQVAAERDADIAANLKGFREEVKTDNKERNGRIGALEKWVWGMAGGAALLGLMSPLFVLGIRESIAELFR